MAMTRCKANLHFFDIKKHDACPYCEHLKERDQVSQGLAETGGPSSALTLVMDAPVKKRAATANSSNDRPVAAAKRKEPAPSEPVSEELAPTELFSPEAARDSLKDVVPAQLSGEEDSAPTELFMGNAMQDTDQKTVMLMEDNEPPRLLAGWLVCTDGPEKGRDYRIMSGSNEIGRDQEPGVDITIRGDNMISRRYHAQIEYDPEENAFYLTRLKNEAVKVNDVKVKRPVTLNPYDTLELGSTKLVFVPLCSDRFRWTSGS